jgi:hypothetical protein
MATEQAPDPNKAGKLAQQIVGLLASEDSTTRNRAIQAAMLLLGETAPSQVNRESEMPFDTGGGDQTNLASFFNREGDMKPSDYAYLCAARHFSEFGTTPFSLAEIQEIAAEAGVVVPDRLDMTFKGAAKKGKKLFQPTGKGSFKPTAAGGLEFAERWKVRPGRKAKASQPG